MKVNKQHIYLLKVFALLGLLLFSCQGSYFLSMALAATGEQENNPNSGYSGPLFISDPAKSRHSTSVADYLFETGRRYYERGNYQQALQELEKAILIEPEHSQANIYIQIINEEISLKELEDDIAKVRRSLEEIRAKEVDMQPMIMAAADEVQEPISVTKLDAETRLDSGYMLGIGDYLEVSVWRNDDLNKKVTIRPDGNISLPLVGELKAAGLTPAQLSEDISTKLSKYIKEPRVSISVTDFGSKKILVLGEVNRPGLYTISGPLTALQAIASAGGYKKYARLKSTMIVRKAYSDNPQVISTDLWSVISEGNFSNDMSLKPGDIVYVPKRFWGKVEDFLSFFTGNIKPLADSYIFYENIGD